MTYTRSATHWRSTTDEFGRTIQYITSNECTVDSVCLCSEYDPDSDLPSRRMVRRNLETPDDIATRNWRMERLDPDIDGPYPKTGLTIWGRSKFDRPTLNEAKKLAPTAVKAIMEAAL